MAADGLEPVTGLTHLEFVVSHETVRLPRGFSFAGFASFHSFAAIPLSPRNLRDEAAVQHCRTRVIERTAHECLQPSDYASGYELRDGPDVHLCHGACPMHFHSLKRYTQGGSDLLVEVTADHVLHDL